MKKASALLRNFMPFRILLAALGIASCGNPIMEGVLAPLYKENSASGGKDGSAPDKAVPLVIALDLGTMTDSNSGWEELLADIANAGKYVALDLSGCSMDGGLFNPGGAGTGKDKIVSLTLPEAATEIAAGMSGNSAFQHWTALKEVRGANIGAVGDLAFRGCAALVTVDLPKAASLGSEAFKGCAALRTVNLPRAASIGAEAFRDCASLTGLNLPEAVSIAADAFNNCAALRTVNLPKAASIGVDAFNSCTSLTGLILPVAASIGHHAFSGCAALKTVVLPEATSIDFNAFQGCTALTEANLPKAASLGGSAFYATGGIALTVTLAAAPPAVGRNTFDNVAVSKNVTLKVPSGSIGNEINQYNTTWQEAFKGVGNDVAPPALNTDVDAGDINPYITLNIESL
ncbi:MAG: leucine-rich repeat domain-containing protein [Spirochaetales bacterium]|jgi:hypothetical protein|nr:leucine-rich repeat domain-containing protein [Spirochaetales bacterium]